MAEPAPDREPAVPSGAAEQGEPDLTAEHLDVYASRGGHWHPEHGELDVPDGWELVPTGDAYLTRTVKAAGAYWTCWRPRGRGRAHRRKLGLWAPAESVRQAERAAEATAVKRETSRAQGARHRERAEDRYREELADAVRTFLDFAPSYADLAADIASGVSEHAAVVGSRRVGRTRTLDLPERAALAARAWIRHRHTDYHVHLDRSFGDDFLLDEQEYRSIKDDAQRAVDAFLAAHRG